ncbi:hypothetical protein ACRALDRAFT_207460 [Sodiomyces alcalophilus JCM 7366]|uniref:uncharacterized protein n=1 Tax=Sodiomyces alcalophilus JCM 7366 TaxID=591952 RepID=UPI0039B40D01
MPLPSASLIVRGHRKTPQSDKLRLMQRRHDGKESLRTGHFLSAEKTIDNTACLDDPRHVASLSSEARRDIGGAGLSEPSFSLPFDVASHRPRPSYLRIRPKPTFVLIVLIRGRASPAPCRLFRIQDESASLPACTRGFFSYKCGYIRCTTRGVYGAQLFFFSLFVFFFFLFSFWPPLCINSIRNLPSIRIMAGCHGTYIVRTSCRPFVGKYNVNAHNNHPTHPTKVFNGQAQPTAWLFFGDFMDLRILRPSSILRGPPRTHHTYENTQEYRLSSRFHSQASTPPVCLFQSGLLSVMQNSRRSFDLIWSTFPTGPIRAVQTRTHHVVYWPSLDIPQPLPRPISRNFRRYVVYVYHLTARDFLDDDLSSNWSFEQHRLAEVEDVAELGQHLRHRSQIEDMVAPSAENISAVLNQSLGYGDRSTITPCTGRDRPSGGMARACFDYSLAYQVGIPTICRYSPIVTRNGLQSTRATQPCIRVNSRQGSPNPEPGSRMKQCYWTR